MTGKTSHWQSTAHDDCNYKCTKPLLNRVSSTDVSKLTDLFIIY